MQARFATFDDISLCAELQALLANETKGIADTEAVRTAAAETIAAALADPHCAVWLLGDYGLLCAEFQPATVFIPENRAHVWSLYLRPEHRRYAVLLPLMRALLQWAKELNVCAFCFCADTVLDARMYERLGAQPESLVYVWRVRNELEHKQDVYSARNGGCEVSRECGNIHN